MKRPHKPQHAKVWDKEYKDKTHLALSSEPSEDFQKAIRYIERESKHEYLNPHATMFDIGCGNGRHMIYLAKHFGMRGYGCDISKEAIVQAQERAGDLSLSFEVRSIAGTYEHIRSESVSVVIDMMSSHVLRAKEREVLRDEIVRMLRPGGWLVFKSFLADEDINTRILLRDHPADEEGAYIHPQFGVYEYVWTVDALREFYEPYFSIEKIDKSHRHIDSRGRAGKRRTVTVVMRRQ